MQFVKPAARSLTGLLNVFSAFWGMLVTEDLAWLFGAIALAGALNFLIGIADERATKKAQTKAEEDRQILHDLQRFVQSVLPSADIPAHLQDLSALSNAQIKVLAGKVSGNLRDFIPEGGEWGHIEPHWTSTPGWRKLSEDEKNAHFWSHSKKMQQRTGELAKEFNRTLRPDALALWEELKSRVPVGRIPSRGPTAIEYGMLAGANPIEEAATALECLARQLED